MSLTNTYTYKVLNKNKISDFTLQAPDQNNLVLGSMCGKTESIFYPTLYSHVQKLQPGLIYGSDPLTAYQIYLKATNNPTNTVSHKLDFHLIDLTHINRSSRCNILSPRFLSDEFYINNIIEILFNQVPDQDKFIRDSAIEIVHGITNRLIYSNQKDKSVPVSLPHIIALSLAQPDVVLSWLAKRQNPQGHKKLPENQTMQFFSCIKQAFSVLDIPEIFWVLSEEEFNPSISNPGSPSLLYINDNDLNSPVNATILPAIINSYMHLMTKTENIEGHTLIYFDDFGRFKIHDFINYLALSRSQKTNIFVNCENLERLEEPNTNQFLSNFINIFCGRTESSYTAKIISSISGISERYIKTQEHGRFTGTIKDTSIGNNTSFSNIFMPFDLDEPTTTHELHLKSHNKEQFDSTVNENYLRIHEQAKQILKS